MDALHSRNMDADEIVADMVDRYRTCRTYQDIGRLEGPDGALTFKTGYERPGKFRFESISDHGGTQSEREVLWTDGSKIHLFFSYLKKSIKFETLSQAIAAAVPGSQGAVHGVSTLLMPEISGRGLAALSGYILIAEVMEDDQACFHIRGVDSNRQDDLWIRKANSGLIKYFSEFRSNPETDKERLHKMVDMAKDQSFISSLNVAIKPYEDLFPEQGPLVQKLLQFFAENPDSLQEAIRGLGIGLAEDSRPRIHRTFYKTVIFDEVVAPNVFATPQETIEPS